MTVSRNMQAKADEVASRLKLIANPNRLLIMCRLLEGEISVGDIETELDIRQPTLSRELGRLRDDGIIEARRESKIVFYSLANPQMERLMRAICSASLDENYTPPKAGGSQSSNPNFFARPKFTNAPSHKAGGYSQFASVRPSQPNQ